MAVASGSPAERAGLLPNDEIVTANAEPPTDVIRWHLLTDADEVPIEVRRNGILVDLTVAKGEGEPLGVEIDSAVFDGVQTCDNHCEFCFIHQLPRGMRRSLYLKDDDYRLSFLYGNFTTLTRFTELDYERVITERLSPLYVSIHATDPEVRAAILQNRRGAVSLRWLRMLLRSGIEVHGQVVVCPGVNDKEVLADTLVGVLDRFSELRTLCVVPLGLSKFNRQPRMRLHTRSEAAAVVDLVHRWQEVFLETLGRRLVFAADEYYIMCGRDFPPAEHYDGVDMQEDGIGMARTFELEFFGSRSGVTPPRPGFFAWVDGAPAEGYRAPRQEGLPFRQEGLPLRQERPPSRQERLPLRQEGRGQSGCCSHTDRIDRRSRMDSSGRSRSSSRRRSISSRKRAPVGVITGTLGAPVIEPLIRSLRSDHIRVISVENQFFGGNIGVTGLLTGSDVARVLVDEPVASRYLLPDVCLSRGQFLDGVSPDELPRPVEVVPSHGRGLREALEVM